MRIIIFVASAKTGHELVRRGFETGYAMNAFVRPSVKLNVENNILRVHIGALDNVSELIEAIRGA